MKVEEAVRDDEDVAMACCDLPIHISKLSALDVVQKCCDK